MTRGHSLRSYLLISCLFLLLASTASSSLFTCSKNPLFSFRSSASPYQTKTLCLKPSRIMDGKKDSPQVIAKEDNAPNIRSKHHQLVSFLSGGLAGTIASSLTMPLEVVKTQLQASSSTGAKSAKSIFRSIWLKDGPTGFFRGLTPMLVGIIPTRAVYFWAYSGTKDALKQTIIGDSSLNHLLSAFSAGIASNTFTNPLWMVKTRFQILGDHNAGQKVYKGYSEVIKSIWKEEGIKGFFKGLTASYIGCFEGAIQWIAYEKLKTVPITPTRFFYNSFPSLQRSHSAEEKTNSPRKKNNVVDLFLMAAASKFIAICLTYPHEVVRTRLREQSIHGVFKYRGFVNTFQTIAREEGVKGLYSGLNMHLIRSVPNAAIMFVSYEVVSNWLEGKSQPKKQ